MVTTNVKQQDGSVMPHVNFILPVTLLTPICASDDFLQNSQRSFLPQLRYIPREPEGSSRRASLAEAHRGSSGDFYMCRLWIAVHITCPFGKGCSDRANLFVHINLISHGKPQVMYTHHARIHVELVVWNVCVTCEKAILNLGNVGVTKDEQLREDPQPTSYNLNMDVGKSINDLLFGSVIRHGNGKFPMSIEQPSRHGGLLRTWDCHVKLPQHHGCRDIFLDIPKAGRSHLFFPKLWVKQHDLR